MKIRDLTAPILATGATAVAIAVAPLANADGPSCVSTANSSVCQSPGNAQVNATPPAVDYQPNYPFYLGGGLLFHHGGGR